MAVKLTTSFFFNLFFFSALCPEEVVPKDALAAGCCTTATPTGQTATSRVGDTHQRSVVVFCQGLAGDHVEGRGCHIDETARWWRWQSSMLAGHPRYVQVRTEYGVGTPSEEGCPQTAVTISPSSHRHGISAGGAIVTTLLRIPISNIKRQERGHDWLHGPTPTAP